MSYKLAETAKAISGIVPSAQSAGTVNGTVIDRLGFWDAIVYLKVGAASGSPTAQGVALKMQTGDASDGSDMADVSGDALAALTVNSGEAELNVDLNSYKRYLRAVTTTTFTGGTTPAIPVAITAVLGNPRSVPV